MSAANAFLGTLTAAERQQVVYAYDDAAERARWSNFPTGMVPRGGLSFKEMNAQQRSAAVDLLKVVLSPMGYEKINAIRMADDDFKAHGSKRGPPRGPPGSGPPGAAPAGGPPDSRRPNEGGPPPPYGTDRNAGDPGPPPGGPPFGHGGAEFGSDLYYIALMGKPSVTTPWRLQFGGHHLALNITIAGSRGVMTPSLTGAQPALFQVNGKIVRPLGRESDKAALLMHSFDDGERNRAVLGYTVADLVLGPGQDGKRIAPEGLPVSAMTDDQRSKLLDLIGEWVGIMNGQAASVRMSQIKAELNDTWFAWSGPVDFQAGTNITAYYRIQGPHLVIEYAPQRDEPADHVHTIYRDPTNDYGVQMTEAQ